MIGQEQGGAILLDATGDVTVDGGLKVNNGTSAIDASGGSIELRAGRNLRIRASWGRAGDPEPCQLPSVILATGHERTPTASRVFVPVR